MHKHQIETLRWGTRAAHKHVGVLYKCVLQTPIFRRLIFCGAGDGRREILHPPSSAYFLANIRQVGKAAASALLYLREQLSQAKRYNIRASAAATPRRKFIFCPRLNNIKLLVREHFRIRLLRAGSQEDHTETWARLRAN